MNLQNGYKVLFEKAADGNRTFYASKTGSFDGADKIGDAVEIGKYKLVYEKDGKIYGSETGVPTDNDFCFEAFDAVFCVAEATTYQNKRSRKAAKPAVQEVEEPKVDAPIVELDATEKSSEEE